MEKELVPLRYPKQASSPMFGTEPPTKGPPEYPIIFVTLGQTSVWNFSTSVSVSSFVMGFAKPMKGYRIFAIIFSTLQISNKKHSNMDIVGKY